MAAARNDDNQSFLMEISDREHFGQALTALRERAGFTVRDIARTVDIPVATAGDYFAGRSVPPVKMAGVLSAIVRACGVTEPARIEQWHEALIRVRRAAGHRAERALAPYPGLAGFRVDQAEWFFGRDQQVRQVLLRLERQRSAGRPLAVIGVSGSGKSSLLRAGVLATLRPAGGAHLLMTPGATPCRALADQVSAVLGVPADVVDHALHADADLIGELVGRAGVHSGHPVTLVIDRFEELFLLCPDETIRQTFLAGVGALSRAGVAVVLGLRADAHPRAVRHPVLRPVLAEAFVLGPMGEVALSEAIAGPARLARSCVTPELADRVLADMTLAGTEQVPADQVGTPADPLPLLSHALSMAWRQRERGPLTLARYTATGGVRDAVRRSAELAFGSLDHGGRALASEVFRALVRVENGTARVRRAVDRAELAGRPGGARAAAVDRVLSRFAERQLLTLGPGTAEIAHDAVLGAWPALTSWLNTTPAEIAVRTSLSGT